MLHVNNVTCHYGVIKALDSVTMQMDSNGIYAVIGANGAGKSTLIKAICGLVKPTSGTIEFMGTRLTGLNTYEIVGHRVIVCPEGRRIFKSVTVLENLMAGAYVLNDKEEIETNLEIVFSFFPRLLERKKQLAGTLSGGEQQMLAIGRALMASPKLLLFDEPFMGLAPNLVEQVCESIERIHKERSLPIIIVEQNSEMALSIADRGYVLEVGKLVLEGTGSELLSSPEVQKKYLGA